MDNVLTRRFRIGLVKIVRASRRSNCRFPLVGDTGVGGRQSGQALRDIQDARQIFCPFRIAGEPIKPATNLLAGLLYKCKGVSSCINFPLFKSPPFVTLILLTAPFLVFGFIFLIFILPN